MKYPRYVRRDPKGAVVLDKDNTDVELNRALALAWFTEKRKGDYSQLEKLVIFHDAEREVIHNIYGVEIDPKIATLDEIRIYRSDEEMDKGVCLRILNK